MSCRACGAGAVHTVLEQRGVPVNSCLLLPDRQEALDFPTGDIRLTSCKACGFLGNAAFEPERIEYSDRYEETQGYSPRFRSFERELAGRWVDRHQLVGGRVVEIGCGKGSFLVEMCRRGVAEAVGIDPSVAPERLEDEAVAARVEWQARFFDASYGPLDADALVCRHTLEHVPEVETFLRTVREAVGDRDTVLLFEVPDALRVVVEGAFWDVYYEHCSFFTPASLARLFRTTGFEVLDLSRAYDDQYLLVEARPGEAAPAPSRPLPIEEDREDLALLVEHFSTSVRDQVAQWRRRLGRAAAEGRTVALWGAGSKAVAFLSALGSDVPVAVAVDINPHKAGMYLAGSGVPIVQPEELPPHDPAVVVAMNPVYLGEIGADLDRLGLRPELVAV